MMDSFDKQRKITEIFEAFDKMDAARKLFRSGFNLRIGGIIENHVAGFSSNTQFVEIVEIYANHLLNVTESVIDKDLNYPEYRLVEERKKMQALVLRRESEPHHHQLYTVLQQEVKALMVASNGGVYNLSASGFRLLDANAKLFVLDFMAELGNS